MRMSGVAVNAFAVTGSAVSTETGAGVEGSRVLRPRSRFDRHCPSLPPVPTAVTVQQYRTALPRQARHRHDVARLGRIGILVGPPRLLGEPPGERLVAALASRHRTLLLAA